MLTIDDIKIESSNFDIFKGCVRKEEIIHYARQSESLMRVNSVECLLKLRKSFESFGYEFEAVRRSEEQGIDFDIAFSQVVEESQTANKKNAKTCLKEEYRRRNEKNKGFEEKIVDAYQTRFNVSNKNFTNIFYELYSICSEGVHGDENQTNELCINCVKTYYDLMCFFYNISNCAYSEDIYLMDKYLNIPSSAVKKLGLRKDEKNVYVKFENNKLDYYMLIPCHDKMRSREKREYDTLSRIWNNPFNYSRYMLRIGDTVGQGTDKKQIHRFSGRPYAIFNIIDTLTYDQRLQIIRGLIENIRMLHSMDNPIYYCGLNKNSFYVCENNGQYIPVFVKFDTIKRHDKEMYTAYTSLDVLLKKQDDDIFIAPELYEYDEHIDFGKTDIFSLGTMIVYLLTKETGKYNLSKIESDKYRTLLKYMISDDPSQRPDINEVYTCFCLETSSTSKRNFAYFSEKGLRKTQQDVLYIDSIGLMRGESITGTGEINYPYLNCLCDGLGDEVYGTAIAELAIKFVENEWVQYKNSGENEYIAFLYEISDKLIELIDSYMKENCLLDAGSTVAVAIVTETAVYVMNIGDTMVKLLRTNTILNLTKVHRCANVINNKGELYQYLGVDQSDFSVEPFVCKYEKNKEDYVMLCTDGLDEKNDWEIINILRNNDDYESKINTIGQYIKKQRNKDNVTVIISN